MLFMGARLTQPCPGMVRHRENHTDTDCPIPETGISVPGDSEQIHPTICRRC